MESNEKQFITGFNSGYLLAEYEPQLLSSLLKDIQSGNSYFSGLSLGQNEYEFEQSNTNLNELAQLRQKYREDKEIE
ncbi:MAG: hypothetical protein IT266_08470 [Saprospiraceae bacterium]|nr:hypothetical protein [Saprospiraceae bacterium]